MGIGDDGMGSLMLKELANELKGVLTIIYNRSLSESKISNDWKMANVTPIFKKDEKCDAGNYRSVSLTSHACKILESFIKDSIINHIYVNNLLNESQHGFISKRSRLTNLLQFIETVTDYVDQGYPVDVIFLDFQKAFDKVPHERLLLKVKAMDVGSLVAKWIESWLRNKELLLMLNVLVGQKLVVECLSARSWAYTICNIYK